MMNGGNFNLSNMTTQQHLNLPSHMVNATPNQATASLNTYFNAAQSQMPQHQHQNYTQSLYGGPRQFTLASNGNGLEKTAYISSVGSSLPNINNVQRYYATTGTAATTTTGSPPNNATATAQGSTILITNNFTQQQQQNPAATNNAIASTGNIRFLPAAAAAAAPPITPVASGTAMPPIQQHAMYNNNNNISLNKDIQHIFSTHLLQQQHQHQHQSQTQHQQQSQQPNFVASTAELISHQFHGVTEAATSTFPNSGAEVTGQAAIVSHGFYVTPETTASSENSTSDVAQKLFSNVNANNNMPTMTIGKDSRILNINDTTNATSSTVVLDRINICINNLYTDTCAAANNNSLNSTTSVQQQQPSPIIPAIQHRAIIDSSSVVGTIPSLQSTSSSLHLNDDSYESNTLIIDEPDSTTTATTPQTPPVTPEATSSSSILQLTSAVCNSSSSNNGNVITTTTNLIDHCSPCSSSAEKMPDNTTNTGISLPKEHEDHVNNDEVDEKAQMVETSVNKEKKINYPSSSSLSTSELLPSSLSSSSLISAKATITVTKTSSAVPSNHLTKTLTPSPPPSSPKRFSLTTRKKSRSDSLGEEMTLPTSTPTLAPAHALTFAINEDVFVKRKDGRLYLGTVMEITLPKYRICFDDKTEVWCSPSEMRKLSISASSSSSPTSSSILSIVATCSSILPNNNNNHQHYHSNNKYTQHIPPICVACKLIIPEAKIEVCERCGRGYHRNCTRETEHGNGIWLCKRCGKSMKLSHNDNKKGLDIERCLSFPYNENSLHWDKKHQTNKQQIYCYCGKMGNYEQNMLQCCRCLNWFHIKCTESFHWQEMKLYRGDRFFVFSCSVCNQGPEYFQRLQMNWNDLVHLCLYNLSFTNYHQKYHHLNKDILPYAMKIRSELPIPHKWINMPADEFKEHIRSTLNGNKQHFKCNRDLVKQELFYGLRCMQPPTIAVINVRHSDVLNDTFLRDTLKLKLVERSSPLASPMTSEMVSPHLLSPLKQKINQKKMRRGASGTGSSNTTADSSNQYDVYEFRLDEEDDNDNETDIDNLDGDNGNENDNDNYNKTDDRVIENDSSEDEIPIKRIMEKVKKSLEKMDVEDDNANDALLTGQQEHPQQQQKQHEKDNIVDKLKAQDKQQEKGIAQTADILLEEKSSSETVTSNEYNENHCHPVKENNMKLLTLIAPMKSRRKRKAFTRTTTLNQMNCDAGLIQRLLETSSSDENSSSSSPSTSLDLIIPPPKNFLGQNNPFRVLALPKIHNELQQQQQQQHSLKLGGTLNSAGIATATTTVIGGSVATTTTTMNLNLCSKLAALKSAGIFPNISTTNLAKAAGQGSRTVRTIKRRLSAKDIIIGPNKEVKRKRNLSRRRLSSNIEVISTTTIGIQPIPTNFFSIHAKDLLATVPVNASSAGTLLFKQQQQKAKQQQQRQQTNTMKKIRIMENTNANSNNNNSSSSSSNNNNNNINNNNNNINNDDDDDDNNNNGNNNDNDHNNNDDNDDDGDNDNDNDDDDDDDDEDDNNNSKNHNNNDKFKLTLTQMESVTSRSEIENIIQQPSHHGRRLRQRPQKISPQTSRRSSISSSSSSTCNITGVVPLTITGQLNATHGGDGVIATKITSALRPLSSSSSTAPATVTTTTAGTVVSASSTCNLNDDLKQNVNKYFGVVNRIESGEKFSISAKRLLPNGQIQYLIEWGEPSLSTINHHSSTSKIALSNVTSIIINPVDEIKFQNINGILQKPFEIKNVSGNNRNDDKGDAANEDDKERIEIRNEIVDITATTKTTTTITTAIVHWSESNKEKYFEKNPSLSTLVAVAPATTTVAAVASSSTVATPIEVATSNAAATTTTTTTAAAAATTTAAVVVVSKIPTEPEPSLLATSSSLSVTSP